MWRIAVFTDEPVLVSGLDSILAASGAFQSAFSCANTADLFAAMDREPPDLLLADLKPELSFGLLAELRKRAPMCRVVLWVHSISTEAAFQAMGFGVRGILRKTLPPDLLLKCLRKVLEGELWFEKALTESFLSIEKVHLTRREVQLVMLLSQGLRNKEIGGMLDISEKTVKVYLSKLFQKVGVKDRFELALFGLKNLVGTQTSVDSVSSMQLPRLRTLALDRPVAATSASTAASAASARVFISRA